jgi:hypothetical protein
LVDGTIPTGLVVTAADPSILCCIDVESMAKRGGREYGEDGDIFRVPRCDECLDGGTGTGPVKCFADRQGPDSAEETCSPKTFQTLQTNKVILQNIIYLFIALVSFPTGLEE